MDSVLVACLPGVCTQKGYEMGLCFDSTFIYGVVLFSESHFLVFSETFYVQSFMEILASPHRLG